MGKKRKTIATKLDEADRTMYASFSSAANSLSQLYSQALSHQKLSFQAGERHGHEKLYQWICSRQQEGGSRVTTADILNFLQNEMDCCGEEQLSMPSRVPTQHQPNQPAMHFTNTGVSFSNALSSPVRRSLQHHNIAQGGYFPNNGQSMGNAIRNNEANFLHQQDGDSNPLSSNDSSMDMHDSTY